MAAQKVWNHSKTTQINLRLQKQKRERERKCVHEVHAQALVRKGLAPGAREEIPAFKAVLVARRQRGECKCGGRRDDPEK